MKKWLLEEGSGTSFIWEKAKEGWLLRAAKLSNDSGRWALFDKDLVMPQRSIWLDGLTYTELNQKELFLQLL